MEPPWPYYLETDLLLSDGRHPSLVCEYCASDITDHDKVADNGDRTSEGFAPQDLCATCRKDVF